MALHHQLFNCELSLLWWTLISTRICFMHVAASFILTIDPTIRYILLHPVALRRVAIFCKTNINRYVYLHKLSLIKRSNWDRRCSIKHDTLIYSGLVYAVKAISLSWHGCCSISTATILEYYPNDDSPLDSLRSIQFGHQTVNSLPNQSDERNDSWIAIINIVLSNCNFHQYWKTWYWGCNAHNPERLKCLISTRVAAALASATSGDLSIRRAHEAEMMGNDLDSVNVLSTPPHKEVYRTDQECRL